MMPSRRRALLIGCLVAATAAVVAGSFPSLASRNSTIAEQRAGLLDPAAWGNDHVGQPVPEYMTGDECLFCHRKKVGPTWAMNSHQGTIRTAEENLPAVRMLAAHPGTHDHAKMTEYLLGGDRHVRYLRRGDGYGKLDLLSTACQLDGKDDSKGLVRRAKPQWSTVDFARKCAGCHSTAVDSTRLTFSAISIDCYSCHGLVTLAHTKDTQQVHLSDARKEPARVIASICGQCHVRGGKSRSTGLPFANTFVAGDNLFRDFKADFSDAGLAKLDPIDQHVMENIRDIVLHGKSEVSCLSCHKVHGQSTDQHQELGERSICFRCHQDSNDWSERKKVTRRNRTCQY